MNDKIQEAPTQKKSKCTIKLLMAAASAPYRIKKNDLIDPLYNDYQETLNDIAQHGHNYTITKAIAPKASHGSGDTSLGAVCIEPQDLSSPIVISFRGTKSGKDVLSDIRLGVTGVVEKELRDEAFDFYKKVREEFPNREIILTGHSLGGHLAQYVGARAYNEAHETMIDMNRKDSPTDREYQSQKAVLQDRLIQVRTFNTAPIDTKHGDNVFSRHPALQKQFVNYRLSSDLVSQLMIKLYYGSTYVIHCAKNFLSAHPMGALKQALPQEMQDVIIGGATPLERSKNSLIEHTEGMLACYSHDVESQFFSSHRTGKTVNLPIMETYCRDAIKDIKADNYDAALSKLETARKELRGSKSVSEINFLIDKTKSLASKYEAEHSIKMEALPTLSPLEDSSTLDFEPAEEKIEGEDSSSQVSFGN